MPRIETVQSLHQAQAPGVPVSQPIPVAEAAQVPYLVQEPHPQPVPVAESRKEYPVWN